MAKAKNTTPPPTIVSTAQVMPQHLSTATPADDSLPFALSHPTHRCKTCGAKWINNDDDSWSLVGRTCGPCCDNAPMGDQIITVEDFDRMCVTDMPNTPEVQLERALAGKRPAGAAEPYAEPTAGTEEPLPPPRPAPAHDHPGRPATAPECPSCGRGRLRVNGGPCKDDGAVPLRCTHCGQGAYRTPDLRVHLRPRGV